MTQLRQLLVLSALFASCPLTLHAQTFTERLVRGLSSPVYATSPAGDVDRLFVLEQETGRIRILDLATGDIAADPFLTVSPLSTGGERGLLGLAFHPDYAENGRFFVYASQAGGGQDHRSQVFEYTVDGDPATSNIANADSRRSIMQFEQPFGNHNGGWIGFDPTATSVDRSHLYIATGDGGSGGDPRNNAQDTTDNLLGKVLRVDVNSDAFPDDRTQNYGIPTTNPFVGADSDDEIFAYGLRNPWRASFDRETGDLWIGDVGQNEIEEIDLLPAGTSGQNFGWRVMEGTDCFNTGDARDGNLSCDDPSLTPPIYEYAHNGSAFGGRSVTGGYLYRGPLKEFQGQYFFSDFQSGHLWTLDPDSGVVLNRNDELDASPGAANSSVASFAEDGNGELYVVSYSGSIYRVGSTSRDARWVGADVDSGNAGDGTTWTDANNWVRDDTPDSGFTAGDHLVLGAGHAVSIPDSQRFSAITFESDATLTTNAVAEIVSGNVHVADSATGRLLAADVSAQVVSPMEVIRKLGPGRLELDLGGSESAVAIKEGTATLLGAVESKVTVANGASLEQIESPTVAIGSLAVEAGGSLVLSPSVAENGYYTGEPLLTVSSLDASGDLYVTNPYVSGLVIQSGERTKTTLIHTTEAQPDSFDTVWFLQAPDDPVSVLSPDYSGTTGGVAWESDGNGGSNLVLTAFYAIQGDADLDGKVGFSDFLILSRNFGKDGNWADGDFDNGRVAFSDFLFLSENYGRTVIDIQGPPAAAIPEPSAVFLGIVGCLALLTRRKRG